MIKILALLVTLAPAVCAGEAAPPAMEKFVCDGNVFTAMVPSDWEKEEEIIAGRQEKQYGVDLYSPGEKPAGAVSLIYFGPDHPRFKTWEKYLATLRDTKDGIQGEVVGKLTDTVVNNRYAKTFDKKTFAFIPPYAPEPEKIEMLERYVIIPAKKGFYALSFKSPKGEAKRHLAVFEKILKSFKPAR
ncbi:MAG: hypothetical protein A2049_03000 [Elusimicrobia bacterium GWA2_62_23]|nr:MAG: hypothetical protein A2049_03000 [Elusimicrobia bacterium GWA2_62_23]OGR68589.1 MAG: hypothetical protein A2179_03185 [Elusimicrobia bacterium GWC2_63_65]